MLSGSLLHGAPERRNGAHSSVPLPFPLRDQPARLLRRLHQAGVSGVLSVVAGEFLARVWLFEGRIAWAESTQQRRGLAAILAERLSVDPARLRELARCGRERRSGWVDVVLSLPGSSLTLLHGAIHEHLREVLLFATAAQLCECHFEAFTGALEPPRADLTFPPAEILACSTTEGDAPVTLHAMVQKMSGSSGIDVVIHGHAAGFGAEGDLEPSLIEAANPLLMDCDLAVQLCVLRCTKGTWAGIRTTQTVRASSVWFAFASHVPLGGVFMGLLAAVPAARRSPSSLMVSPLDPAASRVPASEEQVDLCKLLAPALTLGHGAYGAHVFSGAALRWGAMSTSFPENASLVETLRRAGGLLELCGSICDPEGSVDALARLVVLIGPRGFHMGAPIPESPHSALYLSFDAATSYGHGIAALTAGVSALRAQSCK